MTFIGDSLSTQIRTQTLVDILRKRASEQPDKRAYTFLVDGDSEEEHLTYGELDQRAQAIAAVLQDHGAEGQRVLLLYPPGLEYVAGFLGCLYAGAVAVPAYPPDPSRLNRTLPRLQAMVRDGDVKVALATSPILMMAQFIFQQAPDLAALDWIATDQIDAGSTAGWREPDISSDTLAFLQYTSGSTREPRGVMLSHFNLMYNSSLIRNAFELTEKDIGAIWLPPYHDMGLIGGVLQPAYLGVTCVLMSPLDFLKRPMRWLEAISRYGATISGGPNFAYDLCVRKAQPEHLVSLDLSQWSIAFNGAEPVRAETIDRFAEKFAPCGFRREAFYPCYGLAEATLFVSGGQRAAPPLTLDLDKVALTRGEVVVADGETAVTNSITLVGCGTNLPGQEIRIIDPDTRQPTPVGQVGEIWVSGPSVASGYWHKPAESEHTFGGHLAASGDGPYLRTGDLGFLQQGQLYVGGRLKDLIIIDGLNHYPQDIEQTVEACHPAVRPGCTAAFSVDGAGTELLIITAEVDPRKAASSGDEIAAVIRQSVAANHDLRTHDVVLLKARSIPKTSSGKIQRHACKAGYLDGTLEHLEG